MRKVLAVLLVLMVCLGIAALAFWASFDANRYRSQIEANLQGKFGRPIQLGDISVSVLPLAFRVQDAVIAEDPVFGGGPFATIDTLYVQPRLFPLLRGIVDVKSLQMTNPRLEAIRSEKGEWNFAKLLAGRPLSLATLQIRNGQVAITDLFERQPRVLYDHIDIVLHDYIPERPFHVEAGIHMPGSQNQVIAFNGDAGPINRESFVRTPLDGKLELQNVALSSLQRFAKSDALVDSDAILNAKGEIRNDGVMAAKGQVEIRDVKIRGTQLGYPIVADYNISSNKTNNTIDIRNTRVKLNKTTISAEGVLDSHSNPITLDLQARAANGSIGEIARLASAFGIAFDKSSNVTGDLSFDVRARGPFNQPSLEGHAAVRDLRISGGGVTEPVEVDSLALTFVPNVIRSDPFTAKSGHTSVTAQMSIQNYATNTPQLHAGINTANAELGELVGIARAYGFSTEGLAGSGAMTLNVAIDGPMKHADNWTYSGTGAVSNATLRLPSLASRPLAIRKANLRFSANSLNIDDLSFSIGETTARGNLTVHNLAAPRVEFALSADKINASEWHDMLRRKPAAQPAARNGEQASLLARAAGTGQLSAQTVTYDQLVLSNVRTDVRLQEGVITLSPITAGLYSGQEVGTIVMNVRAQSVAYSVKGKLQNVDANQFLSSVSSMKEMLYGVMAASTDGHFTATDSAGDIARSMNGNVSLSLTQGRLANMDLLHQLAAIGQFTRTARAVEPFTRLIRLNGDFAITNGVARTNNLQAVLEDGSLAADGTVDLADQKLNLRLTAVLSQDYSQTVGGTRVAGLMSTVLSNRQGELVIPILLTGTLKNPQFAPDFEKVARMKLQNLLPTFGDPDRLTTSILGQVLGAGPGNGPQDQPSQRPQPENLLRDLLEGVFGNRGRQ